MKKIIIKIFHIEKKNKYLINGAYYDDMSQGLKKEVPDVIFSQLEKNETYTNALFVTDADYYDAPKQLNVVIDDYEFIFEYPFKPGVSIVETKPKKNKI